MSLEVHDGNKTDAYEVQIQPEVTNANIPTSISLLPKLNLNTKKDSGCSRTNSHVVVNNNGNTIFNVDGINANNLSIGSSNLVQSSNSNDQKLVQNLVTVDGSLVNFASNQNLSIINNNTNNGNDSVNNGTIYLLVSSNDSQTILQPVDQQQLHSAGAVSTTVPHNLSILSHIQNNSNLEGFTKTLGTGNNGEHHSESTSVVQVMNTDGVPVHINVNDVLASLQNNKNMSSLKKDGSALISLSPFLSNLDNTTHATLNHEHNQLKATDNGGSMFVIDPTQDMITTIPNWALHLRDCTLNGDTYTGYVMTENEMDAILNLYKKETQSLFAIRQTPSPAKDECAETVRLMWKSQYVPYDGIPFINVGRRATVMECEHGPRKRSNALKRMAAMSGQKLKKVPNLTCPARLFVKKVRKFPQYRVPPDADPKIIRGMQEHALKMVRSNGVNSGEIRLYMQLPLPISHRYHHIGNSMEAFQKELANLDSVLMETISVDNQILEQLQTLVRQGYKNPFLVRAGLKEYVEHKMEIGLNQARPSKHDKAFYPTLIEIQNMIQQAEAAIEAGLLTPLPTPEVPPMPIRAKRKRTSSVESSTSLQDGSTSNTSSSTTTSSLVIKRMKIDVPVGEGGVEMMSSNLKKDGKSGDAIGGLPTPNLGNVNTNSNNNCNDLQHETIALTLTDNQLENFSVTNFTYDQLAQLAKIGLIALNNAATNNDDEDEETTTTTTTMGNHQQQVSQHQQTPRSSVSGISESHGTDEVIVNSNGGVVTLSTPTHNDQQYTTQQQLHHEPLTLLTSKQQQQPLLSTSTSTISVVDATGRQVEVHVANRDDPNMLSTNDGESILIVTPSDADENVQSSPALRIITTEQQQQQQCDFATTDSSPTTVNIEQSMVSSSVCPGVSADRT